MQMNTMQSALNMQNKVNPVELAILAKWLLNETWLSISEILERQLRNHQLTRTKKEKLGEMYKDFFCQAYYSPVKTISDVNNLVKNLRKILLLLKKLDENAWVDFMIANDLHH
jgi:hypothetical protein